MASGRRLATSLRFEVDVLVPDRDVEREVVDRAGDREPILRALDVDQAQDARHARA
jgi:hypothetical protein